MWLFALFIGVPLIEIALFIQVGGAIGLWPTLAIVVLTALAGTALIRAQGAQAMGQIRGSFSQMQDPTEPLAHGAMILFAGALLLTPGFFTDACGFLLLLPPVRSRVFAHLRTKMTIQSFGAAQGTRTQPGPDDQVIDGDYDDVTPSPRPTHEPSGWTRH